MIMCNDLMCT